MIREMLIVLFIFVLTLASYAEENVYQSPMNSYKDNYFIAGNSDQQVKMQLSFKYNIFYPSQTGLNFGYTQLSNWFCYQNRDTFKTMYQPEVFYRFESGNNVFNNSVIPFVDYFQFSPINHCSTGMEGADHRSINVYYGQIQASYGASINAGINGKAFGYYTICDQNKDINKYRKNYEADAFIKIRSKSVEYLDKEELHFKFGGNPLNNGWYSIELQFRIISSAVQPKLFCSWYNGFNEFMVNYNKKTNSFRLGIIF